MNRAPTSQGRTACPWSAERPWSARGPRARSERKGLSSRPVSGAPPCEARKGLRPAPILTRLPALASKTGRGRTGVRIPTPRTAGARHDSCKLGRVMTARRDALRELAAQVRELLVETRRVEDSERSRILRVPPEGRPSARNLIHYLALRRHDLDPLGRRLAELGLSSLDCSASHVIATVEAVLAALAGLGGIDVGPDPSGTPGPAPAEARSRLREATRDLFGPEPSDEGGPRRTRIMVTMPSEAATDAHLVRELLQAGMDCMRINCAQNDATAWAQMIGNLDLAKRETGRPCRVLMDLAGPKLRTGPLVPGPRIARWRPRWDEHGTDLAPALVWLTPRESPEPSPSEADASLPVDAAWLGSLEAGDRVRFKDLRGRRRQLDIGPAAGRSRWAGARRTAIVGPATVLEIRRTRGRSAPAAPRTRLDALPEIVPAHELRTGDVVLLTRSADPGPPLRRDACGRIAGGEARIPCTLPEVFAGVTPGEPLWFDDGRIRATVIASSPEALRVRVEDAPAPGRKLRADKGINVPESRFDLPALTDKDRSDLDFAARHADIVGLSFVTRPSDVDDLRSALRERTSRPVGIVVKIETRRAVLALPDLLLAALAGGPAAIMIARGDLAVECGYENLAAIQEGILEACTAAHLPVIWATQVLENLSKKGQPTRAEITDAAAAARADCVMLNKGAHVVRTVGVLGGILRKAEAHAQSRIMHESSGLMHDPGSGIAVRRA